MDTNKSVHKGHHPHSHTSSTHGRNRTLTEDIAKSLYELRGTSFKRFRAIVLFNVLVAYQNGSVEGSDSGKPFDLKRLLEEAAGKTIDENLET